MVILDLCGGTGAWSNPYRDAGYDVRVIDLPEDVRLMEKPDVPVRGILAAPPCTMFAASGARWKRSEADMRDAISIVDACLRLVYVTRPVWWVMENPVGKLMRFIGRPKMYFNPCDYGDPYIKKTGLWGSFNPPRLHPVEAVAKSPIHYMSQSPKRAALRSITPPGFAQAFFEANP